MSTNIGLSKTKNSDDILVPVVRFVPISEIEDEDERIELAKTSENEILLERMAKDCSSKVKIALLNNPKIPLYIIRDILSEDLDEEVIKYLKSWCSRAIVIWNIKCCYFLFSKIPDFSKNEVRQAFHSFNFLFESYRCEEVNYTILDKSYKLGLNPICKDLDREIDLLCLSKKILPEEVEEIIERCKYPQISSYETRRLEVLTDWVKSTCPEDISFIRWIIIFGEVYLKMSILVQTLDDAQIRDKENLKKLSCEYIRQARKSEFLFEKDIKIAVETIVDDSLLHEYLLYNKFYENDSLIDPQS